MRIDARSVRGEYESKQKRYYFDVKNDANRLEAKAMPIEANRCSSMRNDTTVFQNRCESIRHQCDLDSTSIENRCETILVPYRCKVDSSRWKIDVNEFEFMLCR